MKSISICLFALNGVLLAVNVACLVGSKADQPELAAASGPSNVQPRAVQSGSASVSFPSNIDAGTDIGELVERLAAERYPIWMIHAVARAAVHKQFAGRRRELLEGLDAVPFWEVAFSRPGVKERQVFSKLNALAREEESRVRELVGRDSNSASEFDDAFRRRRYGFLASDKAEKIANVVSDYAELRSEILAETRGRMSDETKEKISFLERQEREDLAKILTPQELEEYELRNSKTAAYIRARFEAFKPTEEEFRGLFRSANASAPQEFGRQLEGALLGAASSVLSHERYNDFAFVSDLRNASLVAVATDHNVPISRVQEAKYFVSTFQKEIAAIRGSAELHEAQKAEKLRHVAAEATETLSRLLTQPGLRDYLRSDGHWLGSLNSTLESK